MPFRKMLEKEAKRIDAVIVSTPDRTHARRRDGHPAGQTCHCQKPLTHSVFEARVLISRANTRSPRRWAIRVIPTRTRVGTLS